MIAHHRRARVNAAPPIGHIAGVTRATLLLTALSLLSAPARAQTGAAVPAPDPLVLTVPEGVADAEALARALRSELGLEIELDAGDGRGAIRLRIERTPSGELRLELTRPDRAPLVRDLDPPSDPRERTVAIALVAANLVRDESVEILALLAVEAPADPEEAPPEPAVPDPEPEPEPRAPEPERELVPAAIDFAPGLGFSTATLGRDRRYFSFGILGALMGELQGASLDAGVDIVLGPMAGLQIAGLVGVTERTYGAQLGGLLALSTEETVGLQLGVVAAVTVRDLDVAQLAGFGVVGGRMRGGQLGALAAVTMGDVAGFQIGTVAVAGANLAGAQLGLVNVVGATGEGLQLGGVNVVSGTMRGAQLGVVNTAGAGAEGLQLGVVNVTTGTHRGVQIGLVNIADDADAGIGLVSIYPNGRTHLRAMGDTGGLLTANLVHGGRVTHSILSVGAQPFQQRAAAVIGLGTGARITFDEDLLHLDIEYLTHVVLDDNVGARGPDFLFELRLLFGVRIIEGFAAIAGISYQLLMQGDPLAGGLGGPVGLTTFTPTLSGWPVLTAGVELF